MNANSKLFRDINASVKKAFGNEVSFVPCKASTVGSFSALRFAGPSLTVELASLIAYHCFLQFPMFATTLRPISVEYFEGATVINWDLNERRV
jgi:hypothetical protein